MAVRDTDALTVGDVRALTSYVVNAGVARPYGQAPADDRLVVFHDQRGAADQPGLDREGFCLARHPTSVTDFSDPRCPAGTPPRQSIEARAYVFIDD